MQGPAGLSPANFESAAPLEIDERPELRGRRVSGPGGAIVGHPDGSEMREIRATQF